MLIVAGGAIIGGAILAIFGLGFFLYVASDSPNNTWGQGLGKAAMIAGTLAASIVIYFALNLR